MKAGTYFVGDLCYVAEDGTQFNWCDVYRTTVSGHNVLSGEMKLPNGVYFAMYTTLYGDGCYNSNTNDEFPVDSGSIGCIELAYLDMFVVKEAITNGLGVIVEFENDFETGSDGEGNITIGHVVICTGDLDEDEDDDDYSWDEDEDEDEDDYSWDEDEDGDDD